MREIKFRAWDKIDNLLLDCVEINFHQKWVALVYNNGEGGELQQRKFEDIELQQYTNLKDKNSKEIYEGDVVKFTEVDEDSAFGKEETNIVEVKWIEEIAQWRAVFASGRRVELHFVLQLPTIITSEIIGNIYENPELIEHKFKGKSS